MSEEKRMRGKTARKTKGKQYKQMPVRVEKILEKSILQELNRRVQEDLPNQTFQAWMMELIDKFFNERQL